MSNCSCGKLLTGLQTKYCSVKCKNSAHQGKNQQQRSLTRKLKLITLLGGKCSKCGYNKNLAALSFHHLSDKSFTLGARKLSNSKWEDLEKEAKKCELLCSNCHMEEHYPHLTTT